MDHATLRKRTGKKVAWIALISNVILMIGKIVFGILGNSEAVFADGIHSAADVIASIAVLAVIGVANKPPDKDHPFGHGKAEVISEAVVGIILFIVSLYIVAEAVFTFIGEPEAPRLSALFAALVSYIAKEILYRYSMNIGKQLDSKAIIAIAYDHKGDIVASLAASAGVVLAIAGNALGLYTLLYADAVASLIVAYLIYKISKKLVASSVNVLMEKNVDEHLLKDYRSIINEFEEVKRIDQIRARDHGHYILLDLRLSLDHDLTIKQGHDIAHAIKAKIQKAHPNVEEVFIHINPYY